MVPVMLAVRCSCPQRYERDQPAHAPYPVRGDDELGLVSLHTGLDVRWVVGRVGRGVMHIAHMRAAVGLHLVCTAPWGKLSAQNRMAFADAGAQSTREDLLTIIAK